MGEKTEKFHAPRGNPEAAYRLGTQSRTGADVGLGDSRTRAKQGRIASGVQAAEVMKIRRSVWPSGIRMPLRPMSSTITPKGRLSTSNVTRSLWPDRWILSSADT